MEHKEPNIYRAPATLEATSDAEKPVLRFTAKKHLGLIGMADVVSLDSRRAPQQLVHPSSTYSANVDSGVSQDTIYPHLGSLDLPPQSE